MAATLDDATFAAIVGDITCHGCVRRALRKHKIHPMQFYRLLAVDEDAAKRYSLAKQVGCHAYADETHELQERKPPKIKTQFGDRVDPGWVAWQRNRVDARKWHLSKLLPKVYGDRTIVAGDAENPIAIIDPKAELLRGLTPKTPGDGTTGEGGGADE